MMQQKPTINAYLTFEVGNAIYGAHVSHVEGILTQRPISPIADMPVTVKGMLHLQHEMLPVIDMHVKTGIPDVPYASTNSIILLEIPDEDTSLKVGALVDHVLSVEQVTEDNIRPAADLHGTKDLVYGVTSIDNTPVNLINLPRLLTLQEKKALTEVVD